MRATPLEFVSTLPLGGANVANPEESAKVTMVLSTGLPPLSFTVAVATTVLPGVRVVVWAPVARSVRVTLTLGLAEEAAEDVDPCAPPPPPPQPVKPNMLSSNPNVNNSFNLSFGMMVPGKEGFRII
jgi:hypothetical protein